MSIGRRLINLARSELNSLLDKAADSSSDEDLRDDSWGDLHGISDQELAAELERRRQAREEAEHAANGTRPPPREAPRPGPRPATPRRTPGGDDAIRRAYAALEVSPGSDFDTVRKAYRRLMRKYHPDLHTASPEAQRAANDLAQKLTESYKLLEKQLRK